MERQRGNQLLRIISEYMTNLKEKGQKLAKDNTMENLVNFTPRYNLIKSYLDDVERALDRSGLCYVKITFITLSKLLTGWSPIYFITEVPLAWDMILDTPYIAGSEIKGIVKNYFKEVTSNDKVESCLYGDEGKMGKVIFFNAYPIDGKNVLTYDIITPHYNGAKDEYNVKPIPIKFLAINKGITFKTYLAFDNKELNECGKDSLYLLLKTMIFSMRIGWGRKVTRGYGSLDIKEMDVKCHGE
ncbi:type III-B CRISPR module RAMP protein Cmr6 [Saccharolobus solfataricus]|nr:type III-B CRISPR module RAMP protein Cmr6 [Saccharolobus solfataricus]AKA74530.1 type III-B CRISPR module RAMP protein Cmr6 [Saccharolobus solfataricus]AKA77226.1 type III-B CRISPR module RAMP protein Cmr6 [Saccharolobus solfataricus]AKA79918.1 type III-B CRISPR module RAMP protein Cmr6 [Saccharolobus solfataricus]AZF69006.1 type III-B CRISPR module RAMP protein Cmr6 [Saccharolobus solfataricus]AZF71626.1 type III-B CRISPR module RAMP protein Cmr6 [Saccharolobus solfataricus]